MPNELREEAIAHIMEEVADRGYKDGDAGGGATLTYQIDESTWKSDVQGKDEDASADIIEVKTLADGSVRRTTVGRAIAHFTNGEYDWCEFDELD